MRSPAREPATPGWFQGWLNSWRFAIAIACLALLALGVSAAQQAELRHLRQQLEELRQQVEARRAAAPAEPTPVASPARAVGAAERDLPRNDREELERLRAEAATLQSDAASLARLNTENAQLRAELKAMIQQAIPEDFAALREAKDRAHRINCVNNMKQLALAVRIYANDNSETFPKDVLSMSNYMGTTRILICPADTNRQAAANWSNFTPANFSYEYLAPDATEREEPNRVLFRCNVHHGCVALVDGSVQQLSEQAQSQRLATRDGKLYLDSDTRPARPAGGQR